MEKVTIADINQSLYDADIDTEYREAFADVIILLKYVSDSPLRLYMGSDKEKKELEKAE